jgi:hypothetical protein
MYQGVLKKPLQLTIQYNVSVQFLRICSNTVYGFCKIYIKLSSVDVFIVGLLYSYSLVNLTSRTVTPTGIPCLRNVDKTVFCTSGW